MAVSDLGRVLELAADIHPDYPEEAAVFAERLGLFPDGCLVLDAGDDLQGYLVSHPWSGEAPPALNSLLGALPALPTLYYIHDLALAPCMRGSGAAREAVTLAERAARAAGFSHMALVAVNGADGFWRRCGFAPTHNADLQAAAARYDPAALYMTREMVEPAPK